MTRTDYLRARGWLLIAGAASTWWHPGVRGEIQGHGGFPEEDAERIQLDRDAAVLEYVLARRSIEVPLRGPGGVSAEAAISPDVGWRWKVGGAPAPEPTEEPIGGFTGEQPVDTINMHPERWNDIVKWRPER